MHTPHLNRQVIKRIYSHLRLMFSISLSADAIAVVEILSWGKSLLHIVVFRVKPKRRFNGCHSDGWLNPLEVRRLS